METLIRCCCATGLALWETLNGARRRDSGSDSNGNSFSLNLSSSLHCRLLSRVFAPWRNLWRKNYRSPTPPLSVTRCTTGWSAGASRYGLICGADDDDKLKV
ncbi:hypothetical protein VTN49DRAFT_7914 [Thermomyces lanuginosus]|uniref:uncharacterized protein n=1 Tax=Thermomyces lanuginosus TaxID=5541 RepID=UPI003742ED9C